MGKCSQFKITSSELTVADATDSEDVPQMAGALEPPSLDTDSSSIESQVLNRLQVAHVADNSSCLIRDEVLFVSEFHTR